MSSIISGGSKSYGGTGVEADQRLHPGGVRYRAVEELPGIRATPHFRSRHGSAGEPRPFVSRTHAQRSILP